jgi:hypothetical protein
MEYTLDNCAALRHYGHVQKKQIASVQNDMEEAGRNDKRWRERRGECFIGLELDETLLCIDSEYKPVLFYILLIIASKCSLLQVLIRQRMKLLYRLGLVKRRLGIPLVQLLDQSTLYHHINHAPKLKGLARRLVGRKIGRIRSSIDGAKATAPIASCVVGV